MCNTVPIYCGCPNILDIFTEKNLIKVNNLEECISIIKKINCGEIKYIDFDTNSAKIKYLTQLNLINQILNTIKLCQL